MLDCIAEVLVRAKHAVVFTGAGISAESGIPTFRGKDGLWEKYNAEEVASIEGFMRNPQAFWEFARELIVKRKAEPNPAHYAIAELERLGIVKAVITQNIDMLHQKAGSEEVIELHGSLSRVECLECGMIYAWEEVEKKLEFTVPRCECGSNYLKPAIVFFGEALPAEAMRKAVEHASLCDVFIVVGSSLVVYPAAYLPFMAKDAGARLILINAEPTHVDEHFDHVVHGKAGEVLPEVVKRLNKFLSP
ncbi:NAD-dependent protein deacetylase [Archaeoglobus veneficus]